MHVEAGGVCDANVEHAALQPRNRGSPCSPFHSCTLCGARTALVHRAHPRDRNRDDVHLSRPRRGRSVRCRGRRRLRPAGSFEGQRSPPGNVRPSRDPRFGSLRARRRLRPSSRHDLTGFAEGESVRHGIRRGCLLHACLHVRRGLAVHEHEALCDRAIVRLTPPT